MTFFRCPSDPDDNRKKGVIVIRPGELKARKLPRVVLFFEAFFFKNRNETLICDFKKS